MAVFILPVVCYSQEKPSQDDMKGIIVTIELGGEFRDAEKAITSGTITNIDIDAFEVTNEFVSKTPGGGGESAPYNVEVSYVIAWDAAYKTVLSVKPGVIIQNFAGIQNPEGIGKKIFGNDEDWSASSRTLNLSEEIITQSI